MTTTEHTVFEGEGHIEEGIPVVDWEQQGPFILTVKWRNKGEESEIKAADFIVGVSEALKDIKEIPEDIESITISRS